MTVPPFSSLIIVELHFQNSRHRQSHVNLFYCLQGVLNLILHCYCDIVMKNLFFFCDYYRNHYGFANSTRLSTTSFMVYIVRRRWTLPYVCERGSRLSLPQCLLDYFFGLFSNVLWLVVLFQGGISFNPRVLYTVPATLWL